MNSANITAEITIPPLPATNDRRSRPRHLCDAFAEAAIQRPEMLFRGTLRNISECGCYFETTARLSVKLATEVRLHFKLGERDYSGHARVRNLVPGRGMGLEFAFTDTAAEESIKTIVRALGTADLAKCL